MPTIGLYNVDLGEDVPAFGRGPTKIGPFQVRLVDAYDAAVRQLYQPPRSQIAFEGPPGSPRPVVRRLPEVEGAWTITAEAAFEVSNAEQSLLTDEPIPDGGVWDLCQLLTFITGRWVISGGPFDRHTPNAKMDEAADHAEVLAAASLAWSNRQLIRERGLVVALLNHNEAIDYRTITARAACHNAALNVLVDHWPLEKQPPLAKNIRQGLADRIETAIETYEPLTPDQKAAYKGTLCAKAMQGPYTFHDQTVALLQALGVAPAEPSEEILRRVRYMNTVRNRLTHSGEMPSLHGLNVLQSKRHTAVIVAGVLPELVQLAIGRMLGFTPDGLGFRCQNLASLRRFFAEGNWHGQPLEIMDYEEWLENLKVEDFA